MNHNYDKCNINKTSIKIIVYNNCKIRMNALTVQNPHHKCDLGNKNDSVTDKKITVDNI